MLQLQLQNFQTHVPVSMWTVDEYTTRIHPRVTSVIRVMSWGLVAIVLPYNGVVDYDRGPDYLQV